MRFVQRIIRPDLIISFFFIGIIFFVSMPASSFALTPIAHSDVVPNQRIEYGTSFNFGVVAFSKAGINRVDFEISGQGYSGGTKSSRSMVLNRRVFSSSPGVAYPGVYEYYVSISANEFNSNGMITVTPTVHGNDGGIKHLPAVPLYVEGASNEASTEAWVDPVGSDGTGSLNTESDPYPTISSAISAIQTANGNCDYATIYLSEYTYNTGITGTTITTNEWLTITRESGANIENVIIDEHGSSYNTNYIKMKGVTLYSSGNSDYALSTSSAWVDGCRIIGNAHAQDLGGGSHTNPLQAPAYLTDNYLYDLRFGVKGQVIDIVRGCSFNYLLDDMSQNKEDVLYVNIEVDDVWGDVPNTPTGGRHSDFFQLYSTVCSGISWDNIIFYNVRATNLQYGTLFLNGWGSIGNAHTNIAFVNMFLEWRNPTTNNHAWIYDKYDHFLMWHCTISISDNSPSAGFWKLRHHGLADRCSPDTVHQHDNVSYIGNVLYGFEIINGPSNHRGVSYLNSGNSYGNEANYNHYETSSSNNPGENYTLGRTVLDWGDSPSSDTYGYPVPESEIVNRLPSNLTGVMCDAWGNLRDSRPDVGALESGTWTETLQPPQNLRLINIAETQVILQ